MTYNADMTYIEYQSYNTYQAYNTYPLDMKNSSSRLIFSFLLYSRKFSSIYREKKHYMKRLLYKELPTYI